MRLLHHVNAGMDTALRTPSRGIMALSRVTNRPLHVLSGDMLSGQVSLTVIDEAKANPTVRCIRSGHEYGVPHYDLVEAAQADA